MSGRILRSTAGFGPSPPADPVELRIHAEQVRVLYDRAAVAQATVVVNSALVAWVFWNLVPRWQSLTWVAVLDALAIARLALVRAYRRRAGAGLDPRLWARRFTAGAAVTGIAWGAAALVFYTPQSPAHEVLVAFVLGGMTAGAASSNVSYAPAFVAFAAPAVLPMVVRLGVTGGLVHVAMAGMLAGFAVAMTKLSRAGSLTIRDAIRLRFQNEGLVEGLIGAQQRLESLNAELARRVSDRTRELERLLALRVASEARLEATLRSVEDAVIATDHAGTVTLFNAVAERLTRWTAAEALDRPLSDVLLLLEEGTRRPVRNLVERVLGDGGVLGPAVQVLVARDGSERHISSTAAPMRHANGTVLGVVLALHDKTADVEAQEALRRSDQRKDQFIAVMSHELRNPLASIRSGLHVLDHVPAGGESARRAREIVHRQTQHLARLVDDLLDVTRIARDKIQLERERIDASAVVLRVADDHRAAFDERRIALGVETSGPAWIDADATRLSQVVGNLLQNASKFSREGGTVVVGARVVGETVEIRVRDDGIGISPEMLPRIFEPFVQAEGGLARTQGGLGLGLALVKRLAELHGGAVAAHSEGLAHGAEFVVTLPLASPAAVTEAPHPAPAARPLRILHIEDNADVATSLVEVLRIEGHDAFFATTGRAGIAKARELRPDVVLCDIGLPDVDGYEVARTLRADAAVGSALLVALTGYAQPEDRRRAQEAGFDAHLSKPPRLDELEALLRGSGRTA